MHDIFYLCKNIYNIYYFKKMLNVSSPSPLFDDQSNDVSMENNNKRNISMLNVDNPSSRPTLYNQRAASAARNFSIEDSDIKFTYEFKIILLGSISVGKTAILSRYISNEFNEKYQCTIRSEFKVKIINLNNSQQAKLNIWDTCGDEKFRAITRQYYKEAQGIILVYDISNKTTFEDIDNWIEDIRNNAPADCVIYLVGNKTDLNEKRQVSYQDGKDKSEELGLLFNEVSAKNGDNIFLLFGNISEAILERQTNANNNNNNNNNNTDKKKEKQNNIYLEDEFINKREAKLNKKCC